MINEEFSNMTPEQWEAGKKWGEELRFRKELEEEFLIKLLRNGK